MLRRPPGKRLYKESKERMRVKLSYTAQIEEVLPEAAYLLKNLGDTINETIKNYNELLTQLEEEETFNTHQFFNTLDVVRQALGKIDHRLLEVGEIVSGYEKYKTQKRLVSSAVAAPPDIAQEEIVHVENDEALSEEDPPHPREEASE